MGYETILFVQDGDIATITLNRPEVMNCLNSTMRRKIPAALIEASASARVIVLTGAGRGFCAGQDLKDAKGLEDIEFERRRSMNSMRSISARSRPLRRSAGPAPKPIRDGDTIETRGFAGIGLADELAANTAVAVRATPARHN
jgi:1,4-dihydroxy-2-naphthoyl-CoA synthase